MRLALKFAYDGRQFHGYAWQPQLKTVEGVVIKALIKHGLLRIQKNQCLDLQAELIKEFLP